MSAEHEPFADLVAVYALGALDGDDLVRFRAHLDTGCAECRQALGEHQAVLVNLADTLRHDPPRRLRAVLLQRLGRRGSRPPGRARFWTGLRWAASVAVAAGFLAAAGATFVAMRYEARTGELAREVATLREQLRQQDLLQRLLQEPATRVVTLRGLEPSPGAQGRMVWHDDAGGVFLASNLPPVSREKAYELWIIADGKPIPAGVFRVDVEGRAGIRVPPPPAPTRAAQFAVTLEPAAGVPAPTGPMYLASPPPS
jgi:anti-sigma-K factor RskA